MRVEEIHSSDLTADCLRKVYHRFRGETEGQATTALYRGLVAGRACELLHEMGFDQDPSSVTVAAAADTHKQLVEESRDISEAVTNNLQDILAEVTNIVHLYRDRFAQKFSRCQFLGAEIPVRWSLDGIEFASHLDLMIRDTQNVFGYGKDRLVVFDWKWRQEQPSHQYLARYMQFALYYMMVKHGSAKCGPAMFEWIDFGEPPVLVWLHLPSLKPYSRRVVAFNDQGEEQEFVRGDHRPTRSILYKVEYDQSQEVEIENELKMRAKMLREDVFPLNPSPVSCRICDAEAFCTRFDTARIGDSQ